MGDVVKYLSGPNGVTEKIRRAMYDVARQFVYIGYLLYEVREYGYYREHGYSDVYEYAASELDLKKTTVKNLIGINEVFGSYRPKDAFGFNLPLQRSINLQPAYENFKYSQLTEMLSMSVSDRQKVTPDMTVKQIRELKKASAIEAQPEPILAPDEINFKSLDKIISCSKPGQTSDSFVPFDPVPVADQACDQLLLELLCDEYCHWPFEFPICVDAENEARLQEKCDKCPFARMWGDQLD